MPSGEFIFFSPTSSPDRVPKHMEKVRHQSSIFETSQGRMDYREGVRSMMTLERSIRWYFAQERRRIVIDVRIPQQKHAIYSVPTYYK